MMTRLLSPLEERASPSTTAT